MTIDWLKDKNTGQKFYPVTHEDAVIDSNSVTLSTKLNQKENTSNKVTSLSSSSTDAQYPSAKAVYDAIQAVDMGSGEGGSITQVQVDWNQSDTTAVDYIKNKPTLATVATSGTYNDLSGKPTLPEYCANIPLSLEMNYIREPEVKTIKINGSTTNAASTNNCVLQYDTTNNCLKFVFN